MTAALPLRSPVGIAANAERLEFAGAWCPACQREPTEPQQLLNTEDPLLAGGWVLPMSRGSGGRRCRVSTLRRITGKTSAYLLVQY